MKHQELLMVVLLIFFIIFAVPSNGSNVTQRLEDQTFVPQGPDTTAGIKCGSCPCADPCASPPPPCVDPCASPPPPCVDPCALPPPPPPPRPPPPPKTTYCTPPPPRFIYVTSVPGNNLYGTDSYETWYFYNGAIPTQVNVVTTWLLLLACFGVLDFIIIW